MINRVSLPGTGPCRSAEYIPGQVRRVACASVAPHDSSGRPRLVTRPTPFWEKCLSIVKLPAIGLAAAIMLTSCPSDAGSILANKPALTSDYAAVVKRREGKSKSSLPSSREAEALLEINEDMFTSEALEGMSRYPALDILQSLCSLSHVRLVVHNCHMFNQSLYLNLCMCTQHMPLCSIDCSLSALASLQDCTICQVCGRLERCRGGS